jgi:hypothetical protein
MKNTPNFLNWRAALAVLAFSAHAVGSPVEAVIGGATVEVKSGNRAICTFNIGLFDKEWRGSGASPILDAAGKDLWTRPFLIRTAGGKVAGEAIFKSVNDVLSTRIRFTPEADLQLNSLNLSADFGVEALAGGKWQADDKRGEIPKDNQGTHIFNDKIQSLTIETPRGETLVWTFHEPTAVLIQDNRQWGPSMTIRIGPQANGATFVKGRTVEIGFEFSAKGGVAVINDGPTTITAGKEWIPLKLELDIEPGSLLDFSNLGFQDAPAGKHGRVIARPDSQFAFEKDPKRAQRFYGVNFCFSAQYLSHEESDRVADRLVRLGYNAVRMHHYEMELTRDQPVSTTLNPRKLEQFDYLLAAFARRGLYITTDLFVSRQVQWKDLGIRRDGQVSMDTFKILIPVVPAAFENWKAFARALLDHTNPYTKLRYADDPALAWLSMVNEDNYGNFLGLMQEIPEWKKEWNAWLAKRYPGRKDLAAAWGAAWKPEEDASTGNVALPGNIYAKDQRVCDFVLFLGSTHRDVMKRMKAFLREELQCQALVTDWNAWTHFFSDQVSRTAYDYVDDHFYIDHPQFLEQSWRLPSKCPNTSPIAGGASGGRHTTFTRLLDKPFTITEYNYSGPGSFRGVGGILTGALGALQGWGGIWRFAYSHNRESVLDPRPMDYFNMAGDPLGQAAERAGMCLYLRGDMKPAPHTVAIVGTPSDAIALSPMPRLAPDWHWAAWVTRVGTLISSRQMPGEITLALAAGPDTKTAGVEGLNPYAVSADKLMELLRARKILGANNPTDPAKGIFQSETGEITINGVEDTMVLDTPKTAGGYADAGKRVATADGRVAIELIGSEATVWLSSLDDQPLTTSGRILVTHLTDLQNSNIRYGERARQTLLSWGDLPHLVKAGQATVRLTNGNAAKLKVWALSTGGRRVGEVKTSVAGNVLQFTADVAADPSGSGARMLYEVGEK